MCFCQNKTVKGTVIMSSKDQNDYDFLFKIVIFGDCGVGKSSLVSRYTKDTFTESYISTIGVDFSIKTESIGGHKVKIQIWDTSGQERFRAMVSAYFSRGAHGIMIIYDVTDKDSFDNVKYWMEQIKCHCTEGNISQIMVGNKNDLTERKVVDSRIAEEFAVRFGMPFVETSSKDGTGVEQAFRTLVGEIKNRHSIPVRVKTESSQKSLPTHYDPTIVQLTKTLSLAKKTKASGEIIESIEKSLKLCQQRHEFTENMTSEESETCARIKEETISHNWQQAFDEKKIAWNLKSNSNMAIIVNSEGELFKSILSGQKATRVLDVGMLTGYSAVAIAEALPAHGEVVTLDEETYLKEFVEELVKDSPQKNKIRIVIGNALETMGRMRDDRESFDAVFLDSDGTDYEQCLKFCLEGDLLRPGGTILVNNAFRDGESDTYAYTKMAKFGQRVKNDPDLHVVLVPMRNGFFMIRRRIDVDGRIA